MSTPSNPGIRRRRATSDRRSTSDRALGQEHQPAIKTAAKAKRHGDDVTVAYILKCALLATVLIAASFRATDRMPEVKGAHIDGAKFSGERAWEHVNVFGREFKWVGSGGLERAMDYIEGVLRGLEGLEVEIQRASGSFSSDIAGIKFTISYGNVSNIVARIGPDDGGRRALIVNSHVDSAIGSYGVSDDGAAVGVMLEILKNLAGRARLTRPVVFLFNGAEESVLAGAHAFVTQHRWARDLAALINLEAMGSGSTALLFRQGPGASWLAKAYARAVDYPFAFSSSNDVFESGIIPAETDKRIFDELTDVPGYDFVLFERGYTYHTSRDDMAHLSKVGLQHMGETVLSLILELAGEADAIGKHETSNEAQSLSEQLSAYCNRLAEKLGILKDAKDPHAVFFHIFNWFTLTFDVGVMIVLNLVTATCTILLWALKFAVNDRRLFQDCFQCLFAYCAALVAALASVTSAAMLFTSLGLSMIWFGNIVLLSFLYIPCSLVGMLGVLEFALPRNRAVDRFMGMIFALTIFYTSLMLISTYFALTSSAQMFFNLIPLVVLAAAPSAVRSLPALAYLVPSVPFLIFGVPTIKTIMHIFIPLLGRIGNNINVDVLAGSTVVISWILCLFNPFIPLLALANPKRLRAFRVLLVLLSATAMVFAMISSHGWHRAKPAASTYFIGPAAPDPRYSADHPKRVIAVHHKVDKPTMSFFGLGATDALPVPHEGIQTLLSPLSSNLTWGALNPPSGPFEGVRPFSRWVSHVRTYSVPESLPLNLPFPRITLLSEHPVAPSGRNLTVLIQGESSHQIGLRLPVDPSGSSYVTQWSLNDPIKDMGDGGGAWARHVGHGEEGENWVVWFVVQGQLVGDVTSMRLGKSKSELLNKIRWDEGIAPILIQATGTSFKF